MCEPFPEHEQALPNSQEAARCIWPHQQHQSPWHQETEPVAEAIEIAETQIAEVQIAEVQIAEVQIAEVQIAEAPIAGVQIAEAPIAEAPIAAPSLQQLQ
jgi:hypothetical protein